jgi:hypothetical protein
MSAANTLRQAQSSHHIRARAGLQLAENSRLRGEVWRPSLCQPLVVLSVGRLQTSQQSSHTTLQIRAG